MRILTCLTASLLGAALTFVHPPAASAAGDQTRNEQLWQSCIGATTTADDRVTACSAVIDGETEAGRKLAGAYCNRGHGLTEQRQLDAALADLNEAIRIDPAYPCAYTNRGRVYAFKRDFDHAMADYEQLDRAAADFGEAARIAPTDARGWRNRGMIRLYQGDNKGGLADYDKALQYDPADAYSWNNRAQAKLRLGDKAGAMADFRKALEISPGLRTARDGLQQLGAVQ